MRGQCLNCSINRNPPYFDIIMYCQLALTVPWTSLLAYLYSGLVKSVVKGAPVACVFLLH